MNCASSALRPNFTAPMCGMKRKLVAGEQPYCRCGEPVVSLASCQAVATRRSFRTARVSLRILRPGSAIPAKLPARLRPPFRDPLIPFLQLLFGFHNGCEKKTLSLSVDLEPIEVILVVAGCLCAGVFARVGAPCVMTLNSNQILATRRSVWRNES